MSTSYVNRLGSAPEESIKAPCKAASYVDIPLVGTIVVDGVPTAVGDRIAVTGQTNASENGIYTVTTGAWVRATDWNGNDDVVNGMLLNIVAGTNDALRVSFNGQFQVDVTTPTFALWPTPATAAPLNVLVVGVSAAALNNTLMLDPTLRTFPADVVHVEAGSLVGAYDPATHQFTAPTTGVYEVELLTHLNAGGAVGDVITSVITSVTDGGVPLVDNAWIRPNTAIQSVNVRRVAVFAAGSVYRVGMKSQGANALFKFDTAYHYIKVSKL